MRSSPFAAMQPSTYLKLFPDPTDSHFRLLFSTARTSLVRLPADTARGVMKGRPPPEHEEALTRLGMLVPDRKAERSEMAEVAERINAANRRVGVVIILNLMCNLGCVYCYEGRKKGRREMSAATAGRLADFVAGRLTPGKKRLEAVFHGGEPLLSPKLLKLLARHLGETARERGAAFGFSLVTNGTLLTGRLVEELLPLGLTGAKVTLDGPREVHDRSRPFLGGAGSWDTIMARLREVADLLPLQVGGNFTREDYLLFPRLLDELCARGLGPDRLSLVKFDPVAQPSPGATMHAFARGCRSTGEPWLAGAFLRLRGEILKQGYRTGRLRAAPCLVEIDDEFTVNWDGTLYKCPALIGRRELRAGSLRGGVFDCRESHRLGSWKRPECLACAYLPLCFGGCRFMQLSREGRIGGVDCQKAFLEATLEGIIRQDLRTERMAAISAPAGASPTAASTGPSR